MGRDDIGSKKLLALLYPLKTEFMHVVEYCKEHGWNFQVGVSVNGLALLPTPKFLAVVV